MSQTGEKWDFLVLSRGNFWMYESAMVFHVFIFIFCLETTVRENEWMSTISVTVMVIFFGKCHSKSTWSKLCSVLCYVHSYFHS